MVLSLALLLVVQVHPQSRSATAACVATEYGQCRKVRGRYGIYASNDYLWIVGTRHMVVTTDDKLDDMLEEAGWEEHVIFGDFVICPTSPYVKGHLQSACVQSYGHLKMTKRD
jgi:hypothetical protein